MKTLEEIRNECRNENHAARRLLSAGFRLEGWDMNTGRRRVVRRSSRPFLLLLSPRCRAVFAVCRRGQILHLTASRCSGKG